MGAAPAADLTPIVVAVIGAAATTIAAALAMRQRRSDTGEQVPQVIEQWHELADTLKAERDRALRARDAAEKIAEAAIAQRDVALVELRACRLHDHGGVT